MEYVKKSFSVGLGGKEYAEGWDRIFGNSGETKSETDPKEKEPSEKQD